MLMGFLGVVIVGTLFAAACACGSNFSELGRKISQCPTRLIWGRTY